MADDQELMARVKDGEQSALELLFVRLESLLFAFFYRLGCPPGAVEDLTEEVLVTVYRQRRRYDPGRPFTPWLYGIARLVWKDHLRHRRRELAHSAPLSAAKRRPAEGRDPSEVAETREDVDALHRAIEHLSDEQRAVFVLRHYHGLSYEEIVAAIQVPLGTMKWRLHEAIRHLETSLPSGERSRGQ